MILCHMLMDQIWFGFHTSDLDISARYGKDLKYEPDLVYPSVLLPSQSESFVPNYCASSIHYSCAQCIPPWDIFPIIQRKRSELITLDRSHR